MISDRHSIPEEGFEGELPQDAAPSSGPWEVWLVWNDDVDHDDRPTHHSYDTEAEMRAFLDGVEVANPDKFENFTSEAEANARQAELIATLEEDDLDEDEDEDEDEDWDDDDDIADDEDDEDEDDEDEDAWEEVEDDEEEEEGWDDDDDDDDEDDEDEDDFE